MSETEVTTEVQVDDTDNLDTFANDFFGEKTKAEPDAKPDEVEQDSDAETGEVDTKAQTDEPDPNEDPEAEFKEAPPKKKTVQDRIDELVKQREDIKRESAAEIDKVRKEFEAQLAALKPTASAPKSNEPDPTDINDDGTLKYELGEFDPQYIRDLTKFTFAQERIQSEADASKLALQVRETEARQVLTTEWNGKVEAAKTEYPDFQEKATTLLDGFGGLSQDYASYLSTVLMQMDHGTDVLYYLSNNPEEATKIVNSGAQKATLALGRIEAKFYEAAQTKLAAKPKVSSAPTPPPMRTRGTNGAFISVAPDTDDLDAFENSFFVKRK